MRKLMRERRQQLNLSQQEVADRAGLTRQNYSSIERGRTEPNLDQMTAIAKVLKVYPEINFFKKNCDDTYQNEISIM